MYSYTLCTRTCTEIAKLLWYHTTYIPPYRIIHSDKLDKRIETQTHISTYIRILTAGGHFRVCKRVVCMYLWWRLWRSDAGVAGRTRCMVHITTNCQTKKKQLHQQKHMCLGAWACTHVFTMCLRLWMYANIFSAMWQCMCAPAYVCDCVVCSIVVSPWLPLNLVISPVILAR